jgi:hypothetical protein
MPDAEAAFFLRQIFFTLEQKHNMMDGKYDLPNFIYCNSQNLQNDTRNELHIGYKGQ